MTLAHNYSGLVRQVSSFSLCQCVGILPFFICVPLLILLIEEVEPATGDVRVTDLEHCSTPELVFGRHDDNYVVLALPERYLRACAIITRLTKRQPFVLREFSVDLKQ